MSGTCAILGSDAELLIRTLCNGLRHRGPDDEGYFFGKNVALGHRASKLGNVLVHQPIANETGALWITFDGEIFNKTAIMEQLEQKHTFGTNSSAEVALHSYEENGPQCLNQFNGMFAFCIWDSYKEQLFCARDRFGMKPFYYFDSEGTFFQASEIKALLTVPAVPKKPNEAVVYDYLITAHDDHPTEETFFAGIKRLLPAHYLLVDKNGIKLRKYWSPKITLKTEKPSNEDQAYASEFRAILEDSIRIRLPANLPVGTYLSGGIDSASIAYLVNEILYPTDLAVTSSGQHQELFSAVHREPIEQGDEKPYIDDMVRSMNAKTNYVYPSVSDKWSDIEKFVHYVEEPVAQINYYVFWCLSRKAKEKVKVVFYGHGTGILGELESVEEYIHYFKELWKQKEVIRLLREIVGAIPRMTTSSIKTLSNVWTRKGESGIKKFLAPQFATRFPEGAQTGDNSGRSAYEHWIMGNLVDCLRGSDLVSSAFSLEARFPFLDHRIVEFALSIPNSHRVRNGLSKYVLRNAMKGRIPETIRMSRKHFGTPVPLQRWMRQLRPAVEETFASRKFRERRYFNQPAILEAYRRFCEGEMDRLDSAWHSYVFWRILNLELWLEAFFDSEERTHSEGREDN